MAAEKIPTSSQPGHEADSRVSSWIGSESGPYRCVAAILIVTAAVYLRCLGNQFVDDDLDLIVHNRYLGDWSYIWKSLIYDSAWFNNPNFLPQSPDYRPLLDLWLWFNFHLFGLHPAGWHLAMIALHLLVTWLVFQVASLLARDKWTGVLAAALFALMPLNAEAVVWPAAIAYLLNAAFELGALSAFLRTREDSESPKQHRLSALSLGLYAGALLSHESAIAFPVLIAAYAFIFSGEESEHREYSANGTGTAIFDRMRDAIIAVWPYALEAIIYLGVRLQVLGFISRPNAFNPRPYTLGEILPQIPGVIGRDLMLLLMPWQAGPAHPMRFAFGFGWPEFYLPAAALIALCAVGFAALRNHSHRRVYLFCAAWFAIALTPMLNLNGLFVLGLIQDRYLYFPSIALCVMIADIATSFAGRGDVQAKVVWIGATAVAVIYVVALSSVEIYWRDEIALLSRCVEEVPDAVGCLSRLGAEYAARGDYINARDKLEAANSLETGKPFAPSPSADVLYNLGVVYEHLGEPAKAEDAFARAAALPGASRAAFAAREHLRSRYGNNQNGASH